MACTAGTAGTVGRARTAATAGTAGGAAREDFGRVLGDEVAKSIVARVHGGVGLDVVNDAEDDGPVLGPVPRFDFVLRRCVR